VSTPPQPAAAPAVAPAVPSPVGHRPGAAARILPWETLRVLAFLDVVAFHINDGHALLGVGLPIFLILALGLGVRRKVPQPTGEFLAVRVRRLLVPWLAWTAIYTVPLLWRWWRHQVPLAELFTPWRLLYGTREHLWFLPFAVMGGLAALQLDRLTKRLPLPAMVAGCLSAAAALVLAFGQLDLPVPLPQWGFAAASIPLALLLGRLLAVGGDEARSAWKAVLAVGATAALLLAVRAGFDIIPTPPPARSGAAAAAILSAGALWPRYGEPWLPRLEPLLMGAYLAHPLVQSTFVGPLYGLAGHALGPTGNLILNSLVTFTLVALLRRTPLRPIL